MTIHQFNPGQDDELALRPADCDRGHACQFCPKEQECTLDKPHHEKRLLEQRLAQIGQIILVMANKGGVGKSTVSANLAAGLAARGFSVGVADADIHGPNQSRFFNQVGERVRISDQGLDTLSCFGDRLAHPVRVGSLAFMMERDDTPIVWRDAYKHDFMHHLIGSFNWGPLDFLVVDMPPGTGNELITLADLLEQQAVAALIATTPQEVALMDSLKAIRFCQERGMPIIGAVENMAGVTCPHCGGEFHLFPRTHLAKALAELDVASLASIPLSPLLAIASDTGYPVTLDQPDSVEARAFAPAIDACIEHTRAAGITAATEELQSMTDAIGADLLAALEGLPEHEREAAQQELDALLAGERERLQPPSGRS